MSSGDAATRVAAAGIVPVVTLTDPAQAVPLCRALLDGGLDVIEITFRERGAAAAIRAVREEVPPMLVGAGTLTDAEQVMAATDAGAQFGVAPGLNAHVVRCAADAGLPFWPGVCTPSEIEAAMGLGTRLLKLFPAAPAGGPDLVRALLAPYRHLGVAFVPTGGIDADTAPAYWAIDGVAAVGGSWMAPAALTAGGSWHEVTERTRAAVTACALVRAR